jgi:predicted N-acetyltransferase YhbS
MMQAAKIAIRLATRADLRQIEALTQLAVRVLGAQNYTQQQLESALRHAFGSDTEQLIADGTYFVAEGRGQIVGSGGWSRRRTLHAGERHTAGADDLLDPAREPAKLRAFYVHPSWARRGIGRELLRISLRAAQRAGFSEIELLATLTGVPLYSSCGFRPLEAIDLPLPGGLTLPCVKMLRSVAPLPDELRMAS